MTTRKKATKKKTARKKRVPTARETKLDAELGAALSSLQELRARLDEKDRELEGSRVQMSNAIKATALEHYMKLREKYGELPHWTELEEHDQVEWQKIALSVEELRARRQALMSRNYERYRQLQRALPGGYDH